MDTVIFIITVCSPLVAGVLALVVWRFYREECRRSDARIAALTEMALGEPERDTKPSIAQAPIVTRPAIQPPVPQPQPIVARTVTPLSIAPSRVVEPPPRGRRDDPPAPRPRVEPATRPRAQAPLDLPLHAGPAQPAGSTLFHEPERRSPWGARAVVMGGLALAAAAVVLFALTVRNTGATHSQAAAHAAAPPAAAAPGLELLSLRDTRQSGALTITGLVQNPRGGAPLARIVVTAFAFDRTGAFLASGRAPLDYTTLQPGEESPFVVTVPVPDTVARYRIGFRGEDGRVIAHVDRRQAATAVAENHE